MPGGPPDHVVELRDDDPDDLAEAERHDGQVVAAQPQRRPAQDDPGDHRQRDRDRDADRPGHRPVLGQVEPLLQPLDHRRLRGAEERHAVRADREEADVAEVEQAGQADDHVQADRDEHVDGAGEQHTRPVVAVRDRVGAQPDQAGDAEQRQVVEERRRRPGRRSAAATWAAPATGRRSRRASRTPTAAADGPRLSSLCRSCAGPPQRLAEQTGRPEQQHHDQHDERGHVLPVGRGQRRARTPRPRREAGHRAARRAGCRCRRAPRR